MFSRLPLSSSRLSTTVTLGTFAKRRPVASRLATGADAGSMTQLFLVRTSLTLRDRQCLGADPCGLNRTPAEPVKPGSPPAALLDRLGHNGARHLSRSEQMPKKRNVTRTEGQGGQGQVRLVCAEAELQVAALVFCAGCRFAGLVTART